ncbi:radical SAM/SPASM domain-containing protein [Lachnotalea glycerini]|uniref:Radical SAM protein n=1 Tax=Lachnotalea glycerini TaxID=1763509 RepID=A0A371JBZ6_9FIRM|nr:radical SAM protein [Lachnotalea glycerini]RDY30265.1 radical SAM protein [Lachnotalea glycerini]
MYTIYLTTECNFCCSYCYEDYAKRSELTEEKLIKTIKFIFKHSSSNKVLIDFMGGEPLLKKELIYKAIDYIELNYPEKEVKYFMTTNCSLIDDAFIELMKKTKFTVRLSFDGCIEAHSLNRIVKNGELYYENIIENIVKIRQSGVPYSVRMTITENTIPYMYKSIIYLHELGLDNICMIPDVNLSFSRETLQEFKNQSNLILKYYLNEYDEGRKFTIDQFDGKFLNILCDFGNRFSMCDAGIHSFKIMPDGNIFPCGFLTNNEKFIIGNIDDKIDIERASQLAISLFDKNNTKCKNCNIKDFCHGMKCGYMNYIRTGSINIPADSTCEYEQVFFPIVNKILEHIATQNDDKGRQVLGPHYRYLSTTRLKLSNIGEKVKKAI